MHPQPSLVRAFLIPACMGAGYNNGTVGGISDASCIGTNGMFLVVDVEMVVILLMRPQLSLVRFSPSQRAAMLVAAMAPSGTSPKAVVLG